jgi:hypothetical protein
MKIYDFLGRRNTLHFFPGNFEDEIERTLNKDDIERK